jgi:hypothetical protein
MRRQPIGYLGKSDAELALKVYLNTVARENEFARQPSAVPWKMPKPAMRSTRRGDEIPPHSVPPSLYGKIEGL